MLTKERHRGWIRGTPDVSFTAYDCRERGLRTLYLLNIAWWNPQATAPSTLLFGRAQIPLRTRKDRVEVLTLSKNIAILPEATDADVLEIREKENSVIITIQSERGTILRVFQRDSNRTSEIEIPKGGIQSVNLAFPQPR